MKFLIYVAYLFLIYKTSIYLVLGQTINNRINDCTKLYNFIKGNSEKYDNSCCEVNGIECDDEGYITSFDNYKTKFEFPDLTSFPYFPRIETFGIMDFSMKDISNSILKLSTLKSLTFYHDEIEVIPPAIQNLSKLELLRIEDNNIKELPNEMFNLTNLNTLILAANYIEEIPSAIQNLSKLENIYFQNNNIKKLPSEIFKLTNLKNFHIRNNPNLKTRIINFNNSTIQYCGFDDVNILCYEPHTCTSIDYYDRDIYDYEIDKEFKKCTSEDIKEVLSQKFIKNQEDNKKSNSLLIVIIVCVIINFIGFIISIILVKKSRSKRHTEDANSSFNDVFRTKKTNSGYKACVRISLVVTFLIFITAVIILLIKFLIIK